MTFGRRGEVLAALVTAKLHDRRDLTPVGVLKWVLEPLVYMAVYLVLFGVIFRGRQPDYALFLLCALLPWQYAQSVWNRSLSLLPGFGKVVATRVLPRRTLPLVPVIAELAHLALALLLLLPAMVLHGVTPTVAIVWLPLVLAVLVLLVTGPAFLLAVAGLYLPDFRGAISGLFRVAFLGSTALIASRRIPGDVLPKLIDANPLSGIFDSIRDIVVLGRGPSFGHMAYPAFVGLVLLVAGLALYGWREHEFPREV